MIPIRPLIEILEEERMLSLKLDTVYRHMDRCEDIETLTMLDLRRNKIEGKLNDVRTEIHEYMNNL